jgi:prepilin-type N-terminal cleavage/methylation domain-containing protein
MERVGRNRASALYARLDWHTRSGATLLELLVVLVILSVLAGVAGFSLGSTPPDPGHATPSPGLERALRGGTPALDSATEEAPELYLPDGRAVPALRWTSDSTPE